MVELHPEIGAFESVNVMPLYDVHIGEHIDEKLLLKWREKVLSAPNNFVIVGGDLVNMALKNSKSDPYSATMTPMKQIEKAVEFLLPIKDRILGMVPGNHEARMTKDTSVDPMYFIATELGLKDIYSPTTCVVWLKVGVKTNKSVFSIFFYHGSGGGKSIGGKTSGVMKLEETLDADVYVAGHTHMPAGVPLGYMRRDVRHDRYIHVNHYFVNSNDFVIWNNSYAEAWGSRPTAKAIPVITFYGSPRDVEVKIGSRL